MKVTKIQVRNFRLLRDITVDLEDKLSIIIGKNNCGKTSFLLILDKFIGNGSSKNSFSFDDFNVDFKKTLKARIEGNETQIEGFPFLGISLKLFIEYDENDDLSNIGNKVIMDLDSDNNVVVLAFEYYLSEGKFEILKKDYKAVCDKRAADQQQKDIFSFLKESHTNYFQISKKSLRYDRVLQKEDDRIFTDLSKEKALIDKIINFQWISARRSVSNKDSEKSLSSQSSRIYKRLEANNSNLAVIEEFKKALSDADNELNKIYDTLFHEVIEDVKRLGGVKQDESIIKIVSSLQHKELLEENTTVMYGLGSLDHSLPENYSGLGYMNLISMIFEIKILVHEFQKEKGEKPSDINLLFIEEPEVHTHPQMQRIFIRNIKSLLQNGIVCKDERNKKLQTILTTHSSHIVSESDFEDIKYFKRHASEIVSKNLKDLKSEYGTDNSYYKFLKQYLTLHRSELFFADKAIFIEGDTERVLLPAMMKKLDQEDIDREVREGLEVSLPLLSQNVSVIEVGNYSQVFEKFIDFVGIRSLIVTDLDAGYKEIGQNDKRQNKKCSVANSLAMLTTNSSLRFFYGDDKKLADFTSLPFGARIMNKNQSTKKWELDSKGHLLCTYQNKETNSDGKEYHASSFEDAFLHINMPFIKSHALDAQGNFIQYNPFGSLKNNALKEFVESGDAYELAMNGIDRKPSFVMEILLNSTNEELTLIDKNSGKEISMRKEFSNWKTPAYIREGLEWLKQG